METKQIDLSVSQEIFLRSRIRAEITRLTSLVTAYNEEGLDSSILLDDIDELKILYFNIFGEPFKTLK